MQTPPFFSCFFDEPRKIYESENLWYNRHRLRRITVFATVIQQQMPARRFWGRIKGELDGLR